MDHSPDFDRSLLATVPHLRAFARSLCRHQERADDLVQETLLKAWEHRASLRVPERLKPWLFTILRNAFYHSRRHARLEVEDADGTHSGRVGIGPAQSITTDFHDAMSALDCLPEDQREAIVLVFIHGMSYEEAAEICVCSVGTLKSRINRGRKRLADDLGLAAQNEFEPEPAHLAACSFVRTARTSGMP